MAEIVNFYVTMDKKVCDALKKRALELGFDSVQDYIRTWAAFEALGYHKFLGTLKPKRKDATKRIRTIRDSWK